MAIKRVNTERGLLNAVYGESGHLTLEFKGLLNDAFVTLSFHFFEDRVCATSVFIDFTETVNDFRSRRSEIRYSKEDHFLVENLRVYTKIRRFSSRTTDSQDLLCCSNNQPTLLRVKMRRKNVGSKNR
ncbi:uncharacterized protein LOC143264042 isoform X2 [Megachile rotundata]|uniref:uncharacterized protein LOC143264042 isoform X2 n=1 Tax=Megachile rotundata TaxID=143995 RepID=UPI003FD0A1DE